MTTVCRCDKISINRLSAENLALKDRITQLEDDLRAARMCDAHGSDKWCVEPSCRCHRPKCRLLVNGQPYGATSTTY
jgi:hypothetical protein